MNHVLRVWPACRVALVALAMSAPAMARTPGVEQAKAESGLRFSENVGLGNMRSETPAVWAGDKSGRRADLTVNQPKADKKSEVPTPKGDGPGGGGSGDSLGTMLLGTFGGLAGYYASHAVITAAPFVVVAVLAGSAIAGAGIAYKNGERGWTLARRALEGAAMALTGLVVAGASAGRGAGRFVERIFKR